tara:strand:- start:338 stop:1096 length:759 start_codon:yes stop_codon:yes gene_type:complete
MGYISKLIKPTPAVATMIQSNTTDLPFAAGDLICDWTSFQIPVGTVKLESVTLLVTGQDGTPQTSRDVVLYFAKGNADGTAPSSLGTGNITASGKGFYNNILGHTILDILNYDTRLDFASIITAGTTNSDSSMNHTNLVLESAESINNQHTLYVGVVGGAANDFDFSTGVLLNDGDNVAEGDTALVTDGTDADKVFNPGDVILKHDSDTVVGTVKSVSANLITLESGSGVAITDDDELVHASPIKIRLGFAY